MSDISEARKEYVQSTLSPMTLMFPTIDLKFIIELIKSNERKNQKANENVSENTKSLMDKTDPSILNVVNLPSETDKTLAAVQIDKASDIEAFKTEQMIEANKTFKKLIKKFSTVVKPSETLKIGVILYIYFYIFVILTPLAICVATIYNCMG